MTLPKSTSAFAGISIAISSLSGAACYVLVSAGDGCNLAELEKHECVFAELVNIEIKDCGSASTGGNNACTSTMTVVCEIEVGTINAEGHCIQIPDSDTLTVSTLHSSLTGQPCQTQIN